MFRSMWMRRSARGATLLLVLAMVATLVASYAVDVSAATSTVQIASGLTAPTSGLIINGSATNPATGQPFRHIWYGNFAKFKPGQLTLDPRPSAVEQALGVTNAHDLYAVDIQAKTQGIIRLHLLPDGDSGHGVLDLLHEEVLGGFNSGCGLPGNFPNTNVLGPDGNLYVGFKRSGNIVRVVAP